MISFAELTDPTHFRWWLLASGVLLAVIWSAIVWLSRGRNRSQSIVATTPFTGVVAEKSSNLRWWLLATGLLAASIWGVAVFLAETRANNENARLQQTLGTTQYVTWKIAKQKPYGLGTLTLFDHIKTGHTLGNLIYTLQPPVGGPHRPTWQNCGIYSVPLENGLAVHSLEHGAVWITYRPDLNPATLSKLRTAATTWGRVLVSPYLRQNTSLVATAWGAQLRLIREDFGTLKRFVEEYQGLAPEPRAPC
jgi:hypothetical protein